MSRIRLAAVFVLAALQAGCATGYTMVAPAAVAVNGLQVTPVSAWNRAPVQMTAYARKRAEVWTHDGMLLDRMIIIPGVVDGETLFVSREQDAAFPVFRASMLPNEIEELTESSVAKVFGEGNASVSTSGLRPHRFGEHRGVLFNLAIAVTDGPDYRGLVGSFVAGDRLYMVIYVGADPYYYDKHLAEAEALITGARLVPVPPAG
jgi:hypothetical protein